MTWVLIIYLAMAPMTNITVPGIASEAACHDLYKRFMGDGSRFAIQLLSVPHSCLPYEAANSPDSKR